jgi:hypothetical protein
MKLAKGNKTLATEMMVDAMRIDPQTPAGEILRTMGRFDAMTATWTNKSKAAEVTESLRGIFNQYSGDLRAGDLLFPFIKTRANVISTGLDYAGLGIPKALGIAYNAVKLGKIKDQQTSQEIYRNLVRAGLGITGAIMVSKQFDDDDFMGAYDPARAQIESLRNSTENSMRIPWFDGTKKWVSMDWFGPLDVPVTAIMYARKYGKKGWGEKMFQYAKGMGTALLQLPVISDIIDYAKGISYKKDQTLEEMTGETANYLSNQIYSRLVPSFLSDLAKATDEKERQATKGIESIKSRIPGLRQTLPEKKNIFGEAVTSEPAWSDILFGSRIKTSNENAIIDEINRVSVATDKGINFTNWDKSISKTLAQFKEKKGQEIFERAKAEYGQKLKQKIERLIVRGDYKNLNDEEKLRNLNDLDSQVMKEIFDKYSFKYVASKSTPLLK